MSRRERPRPIEEYLEGSIIRRARKPHRCWGGDKSETACADIARGQVYIEYVGETSAYQSGARYCVPCAEGQVVETERRGL